MQKKTLTVKLSATKKPNVAAAPAKKEGASTRKNCTGKHISTVTL